MSVSAAAVRPFGPAAAAASALAAPANATAALHSAVTLKDGKVEQGNFHDYLVLRMPEMPQVEVAIIESDARMGGVGEPGTPPIATNTKSRVWAHNDSRSASA